MSDKYNRVDKAEEQIIKMRIAGVTVQRIARTFGVSIDTIYNKLNNRGIR